MVPFSSQPSALPFEISGPVGGALSPMVAPSLTTFYLLCFMAKTREQKIFGAAVLKTSFKMRDALDSAAFHAIYPGVLRDLALDDAAVDKFIDDHREEVEKAARGQPV